MKSRVFILMSILSVFFVASGLKADGTADTSRIYHCSLLIEGNAFGGRTRQLGFDIHEGQPVNLNGGWRVSIHVSGGSFAAGTMLFASVQRTNRSRNLLTVVSEAEALVLGGAANIWGDEIPSGMGSASIYLTCSADLARGISPDAP